MSIADAVSTRDRKAMLEAALDEIAARLPDASASDAKALLTELRLTAAELDALGTSGEGDAVDDLAQRRTAKAEVPQRPARRGKRRAAGD